MGYAVFTPNALSSDKKIVVGYTKNISKKCMDAFIWTQENSMLPLPLMLGKALISDFNDLLNYAVGCNSDGTLIIGKGYRNGKSFDWSIKLPHLDVMNKEGLLRLS